MKTIAILIAATAGTLITLPLQAAEEKTSQMSRGDRVEAFKEDLNLTNEQCDKIRPILQKQREQVQALRENDSIPREQRLEKARELVRTTVDEIRPILTAEQKDKIGQVTEQLREAVQTRLSEHRESQREGSKVGTE